MTWGCLPMGNPVESGFWEQVGSASCSSEKCNGQEGSGVVWEALGGL